MKLKTSTLLIAGALFGAAVMPAQADNQAMVNLLKVLRDKGTISTADYSLLANAAKADKEAGKQIEDNLEKVKKQATTVSLKGGHLKIKSDDGAFKAQIGGRIMTDYAWIDDDRNLDGNGSELRRARLFIKGQAFHDWGYKLQLDFAGNETEVKDAYIQYKGWGATKVTVGNQHMPFGLEELTSSKYITFMERSTPNDLFATGRKNGLSVSTHGDNWSFAAAAHLDGIDNENKKKDENYGYGARVTFAPIAEKKQAVHLGASWHHQEYENLLSNGSYEDKTYKVRTAVHTLNSRPVSTKIAGVEDSNSYGLEAATVYGPFSAQTEYFTKDINTQSDDVTFSGWYVYGSYFLTGESRAYDAAEGVFGRIKPSSVVGQGGYGAWELALRYSSTDADDNSSAVTELGEEANVTTIGLNWYPTSNIRLMANYVDADIDYASGEPDLGDIKAFQVRGQIDF